MFFAGCQKQELVEQTTQDNSNKLVFKSEKGLLCFDTEKKFTDTYNTIETMLTAENYTDSAISIILEKNNSYNSMMHQYLIEEENWLNNYELDLNNDPDDKYIDDDVLRLLLNNQGEIIIDNSIYKFVKDDIIIKIKNKNWELLEQIRKAPNNISKYTSNDNIVLLNYDPDKSSCRSNFSKHGFENYKTDRLVKWKASIINTSQYGFPITSVKAKTKSYKRKNRRWVKYNTHIIAKINSFTLYEMGVNNGQCSENNEGTDKDEKKVEYYNNSEAKCRIGNSGRPFTIRNNTITMYYYCNGWSKTYTLDW